MCITLASWTGLHLKDGGNLAYRLRVRQGDTIGEQGIAPLAEAPGMIYWSNFPLNKL